MLRTALLSARSILLLALSFATGVGAEAEERLPFVGPPLAPLIPILLPEWHAGPIGDDERNEQKKEKGFPDRTEFFPYLSRPLSMDLARVRAGFSRGWKLRLSLLDPVYSSGLGLVARERRREVSYPSRLMLGSKAGAAINRRYVVGTVIRGRSGPAVPGWMWVRINVHRSRIIRDHRFEDSGPTAVAPEIEFASLWLETFVRAGVQSTVRAGDFEFTFKAGEKTAALPFAVARPPVTFLTPRPGLLSWEEQEDEDEDEREQLVLLPPPAMDPGPVLRVQRADLAVDLAQGGSLVHVAGRIRPVVVGRDVLIFTDMSLSGVVVRDLFLGSTTVVTREADGVRIRMQRGSASERPIRRFSYRRIDPDGDRLEPALLSDLRLAFSCSERFHPLGKAADVTVEVVGQ